MEDDDDAARLEKQKKLSAQVDRVMAAAVKSLTANQVILTR